MKRNGYVITWLLFGCLFIAGSHGYSQSVGKFPNIIFILADDMGYGDVECLNPESQIPTPNLNRLGQRGIMFTNAHSPSSVCTPSRYGLLTGRYAFRTSLKKGVLGGYSPALIEHDRFTLADLLKRAGYRTAVIGKWHLGLDWKPLNPSLDAIRLDKNDGSDFSNVDFASPVLNGPNSAGFDYSYVLPASLDMSPYLYLENGVCTDYPLVPEVGHESGRGVFWRGGWKSNSFIVARTLDEIIDRSRKFIGDASKNPGDPFFLYLPLTAPHTPWLPPDKFAKKSNAGTYGDFVAYTDNAIGRILDCLDSLKIAENTMVIFTSDNGADWKQNDMAGFPQHKANFVFRGEKSDIWEGGHHVPLIITWPNGIKGKRKVTAIFSLTDMVATLAGMTAQNLPGGAAPDSYDLWPLVRGDASISRPSIIYHSIFGTFAIQKGKWKFIDGRGSGGWSKTTNDSSPVQLYDMEKDERETANLYREFPEVVKELKELLEKQKDQGYSVGPPTQRQTK